MTDIDEMFARLQGEVDLIIDSGSCGIVPTTVVDLTGEFPVVVREGKGGHQQQLKGLWKHLVTLLGRPDVGINADRPSTGQRVVLFWVRGQCQGAASVGGFMRTQ